MRFPLLHTSVLFLFRVAPIVPIAAHQVDKPFGRQMRACDRAADYDGMSSQVQAFDGVLRRVDVPFHHKIGFISQIPAHAGKLPQVGAFDVRCLFGIAV